MRSRLAGAQNARDPPPLAIEHPGSCITLDTILRLRNCSMGHHVLHLADCRCLIMLRLPRIGSTLTNNIETSGLVLKTEAPLYCVSSFALFPLYKHVIVTDLCLAVSNAARPSRQQSSVSSFAVVFLTNPRAD